MILTYFDVAYSTKVSPLSVLWPRSKHPVAIFDVYVCPPNFAEFYDCDHAVTKQTYPKHAWELEAALRKAKYGKEAEKV